MTSLALIGCGRLGEAVLAGILGSDVLPPEDVVVTARRESRVAELVDRYGVTGTTDNYAVVDRDVVMLSLKPQTLPGVLTAIGADVPRSSLVVSLAAGVSTATLDGLLPADPPIVRVMSNIPALVHRAMSVVAAGPRATDEQLALVQRLVAPLGVVRLLPESSIDVVTALSGSGPAYVFLLAEALAEAGVLNGLTRADAVALATETVAGAGELLAADLGTATELREQVTSPGGTTAAALRELEAAGMRAAVLDAVTAAVRRAGELG